MSDRTGYVYVLSNDSMPGVVKIGRSINGGQHRAKAIFSTGVPTPFYLEFEILVDDAVIIEQTVHECLEHCRVSSAREFFRCDVREAIRTIMNEYASYIDLAVCEADEFRAIEGALYQAAKLDVHPVALCHSIHFLSTDAVKMALAARDKFLKGRGSAAMALVPSDKYLSDSSHGTH